ncbi:MAG: metallophosphoesterase [Bacteroidales bacterium]|nr:metallophosphoesterase [Bacteroidales bacterium]
MQFFKITPRICFLFAVCAFFIVREAFPKPNTVILILTLVWIADLIIDYWLRTNKSQLPQRTFKIFLWGFYASIASLVLLILGLLIFGSIAHWAPILKVYVYGILLAVAMTKISLAKIFVLQFLLSKIPFVNKISLPKRWFQASVCIAVFSIFAMFYGSIFEAFNLRVRHVKIQDQALPKNFEGYRIVLFSDMHIGSQISTRYVRRLVDSINAQNADLVVFAGDMVNFHSAELVPFASLFSEIRATDGVFAVLGNHDYGGYLRWETPEDSINDIQNLLDLYKSMDWNVLRNEHVWLHRGEDSIALAGVEVYSNHRTRRWKNLADTEKSLKGVSESDFIVMITHNPEHFNEKLQIYFPYVNLTLTGHSHGGQVAPGIRRHRLSVARLALHHWRGFYEIDGQKLFVDTGAGFNMFPFRFKMPPSISVLVLER